MATRIEHVPEEKVANKAFSCDVDDMVTGVKELNKLLDEGWLVEGTEIVANRYVVMLKQTAEPRKIIYIDVGDMDHNEASQYVKAVQEQLRDMADDVIIPVRG